MHDDRKTDRHLIVLDCECICDPPQWFEGWCTSRLCWRGVASGWYRGWTWDSAGVGYSGPPYCTSHTGTSSRPSNTRHSCPSERHTYTDSLWDTGGNYWRVFWMNAALFYNTIYTTIWDLICCEKTGVTSFYKVFWRLGWPIWQFLGQLLIINIPSSA